jgi:alpha-beta hydrolase superfamily lysophospholipase
MHVELVRTVTKDALRLDGALTESRPATTPANSSSPTAAIFLHGVASNFYSSGTFEPLVARLQQLGIAALSVNTRGHDSVFGASLGMVRRRFGAAYEIVDDCRLDIAAWIEFLKSRGHERLALIGHSLGAVKAIYGQAHEQYPQVTALIAASAPRLSYTAFMNSRESSLFWESAHAAQELTKAGQSEELFTSKFPFPMLMTAATFLDKYGPAERYNVLKFADRVLCPSLLTYGSKELVTGGVPFAGMPEALTSLPNSARRTVAVIEGADHLYSGVASELADVVTQWLLRQQ